MSEIKAFFIRLVILLIFLWLLFGVFFGITPMRGNDMFPRISAGDLLLYYRLEKNFNSGDVLVFRKQGKISTGRVVAHGGDSVEITGDGELKVNGSIVIETNVFYKTYPYDKESELSSFAKERRSISSVRLQGGGKRQPLFWGGF